jgi:hypothetical protein
MQGNPSRGQWILPWVGQFVFGWNGKPGRFPLFTHDLLPGFLISRAKAQSWGYTPPLRFMHFFVFCRLMG